MFIHGIKRIMVYKGLHKRLQLNRLDVGNEFSFINKAITKLTYNRYNKYGEHP